VAQDVCVALAHIDVSLHPTDRISSTPTDSPTDPRRGVSCIDVAAIVARRVVLDRGQRLRSDRHHHPADASNSYHHTSHTLYMDRQGKDLLLFPSPFLLAWLSFSSGLTLVIMLPAVLRRLGRSAAAGGLLEKVRPLLLTHASSSATLLQGDGMILVSVYSALALLWLVVVRGLTYTHPALSLRALDQLQPPPLAFTAAVPC